MGRGADGEELWIFGYGSLVWRPAFPHVARRPAWLHGFARRFWQGSTDHRGVPGAPGRVVTLVAEPAARCLGVAYRVGPEQAEEVLAGLDHREKGGYARLELAVELEGPRERVEGARVYVATDRNPNYLG
ncbi:MAG: gamma-glutamylcyclotransferase, partial [Myxococcota bacterium]|nr:gamma-glutamylcyclotransferase [Myxococcota bacterium]